MRGEAFPYEHHGGDAVPALKFTGRIEEDAIRIGSPEVSASLASVTRNGKRPSCARISRSRST